MKKKLLAMLLAAVMVTALLPTAFAADSEPVITTSPVDLETLRMENTTFILQFWQRASIDDAELNTTLTREAETLTTNSDDSECYELPLGVTLTVNAFNPESKFDIEFFAWSDPDNDGVYEERIPNPEGGLFPANVAEPLKAGRYVTSAFYLDGDLNGSSGKVLTEGAYATLVPWTDPVAYQIPSTFRISSDYLTELYGPNTFLEIALPVESGYGYYHFLLTGEQVDPAEPTEPTEPETPEEPTEPTEPETPTVSFTDVADNAYYAPAVAWAANSGVTDGYSDGTFRPNDNCTRAQIVTFLWRAYGKPEPTTTENPFTDVKSTDYYYKAVLWAVENNITGGTGDGTTFTPDGTCTRKEAVTFQYRAADRPDVAGGSSFSDVSADEWYADAVAWAVANKVTSGTGDGTTFSPNDNCIRGQIVTFLYKDPVVGG